MDYSKIGLKAGLEIHQQLDTGKLFCSCPGFLRSDEPDYVVERKLHVVAGESGEVDAAAKHEAVLDKKFIYQCYHDNVCLIDLDEEPPREINKDALMNALHIALLLNCRILPLTQIMRKTVIDGSNTSGFQRTVLIAQDGFIETSDGKVRVESVCLEEDAARIVSREKDKVVYRLDRLGIPLVEIATAPDIKTPEQAKEAALVLGGILRSCKIKRGLGTIRQDVNMSIKGGNRVEIKGFQDIRSIEEVMVKEIERQKNLLEKKKEIPKEVRNALPDGKTEFLRPMPGASRMYPETDLPLLKIHRDLINEAKKTLPKLKSEIEEELRNEGLNEEMIKLLLKDGRIEEYKDLLQVYRHPNVVAKILLVLPKEIAAKKDLSLEDVESRFSEGVYHFILEKVEKKELEENQIKDSLIRIIDGEDLEKAVKFEKQDDEKVEEFVAKIVTENSGLRENAYMGMVMKEFKGKVNAREVMDLIKKYVN